MKKNTILILIVMILALTGCSMPKLSLFPEEGPLKEQILEGAGEEKILVISVGGVISDKPQDGLLKSKPSMVQEIVAHLRQAETDPKIKGLLLKVNSPGGTVTASDIIYHEIAAYKEKTGVKMVVAMMDVAASGGYYISLPADWIMAHPTTVTGSIGVIFARPQVSGLMEKVGLGVNVSKSGVYKDMGSPFRTPTEEEGLLFQGLTDTLASRFHQLTLKHRKLTPEQHAQIATARVFLAPEAKAIGLVDELGYLSDAVAKSKSLAGLPPSAKVITYRRGVTANDNIYNSPSGSDRARELNGGLTSLVSLGFIPDPGFYYVWPEAFGN
jgi:protease-4